MTQNYFSSFQIILQIKVDTWFERLERVQVQMERQSMYAYFQTNNLRIHERPNGWWWDDTKLMPVMMRWKRALGPEI